MEARKKPCSDSVSGSGQGFLASSRAGGAAEGKENRRCSGYGGTVVAEFEEGGDRSGSEGDAESKVIFT